LIRSAYLPLIVLLPLGVLLGAFAGKRPHWRWLGGIGLGTSLGLALLFQWWRAGQESLTDLVQPAWFPAHLLEMEPFLFKTFFYYGLPHEQALSAFSPVLYQSLQVIAYGMSGLFLLIWLGSLGRKNWRNALPKPLQLWGYLGLVNLLLTVGMLSYLSLRIPPENWNWGGFWTFVMEPRYFAPIMGMWLLYAFGLAAAWFRGWLRTSLRLFLLGATLAACTYPVYVRLKMYVFSDYQASFVSDSRPELLTGISQKGPYELPLVLTTFDNCHLGALVGASVLPWDQWEGTDVLFASRPVLLMGLCPAAELTQFPFPVQRLGEIQGQIWWQRVVGERKK
jgi:hypothetical protein